jgi:hypothetical protein
MTRVTFIMITPTLPVGKMLAREMMEDAGTEEIDVDWDYEFEETEDEGDEWKDE